MDLLLNLLLMFIKIGTFAFGGGYAVMSLIFEENHYNNFVQPDQVNSIIALAQSLPGPFAINSAIGYGYHAAGLLGVLFCLIGILIPCLTIMLLVIRFVDLFKNNKYIKGVIYGITPAVIGVIGAAAFKLITINALYLNVYQILLVAISFVLFLKTKIHPIFLILLGGVLGILLFRTS
ncbi:MAG: chromate transporter [Bacillota bacterium]